MQYNTLPSVQPGEIAAAENQQTFKVQIDYDLEELTSLADAASRTLSIPEITDRLYVVIGLETDYRLRISFSMADLEVGHVILRSPGNGSVDVEADTVIQELEHRSQSMFYVDSRQSAMAWIRHLGATLASLDQFWGCSQVDEAAKARLQRLREK